MEDASWLTRVLFHHFMELARRVGSELLAGGRGIGPPERLLYAAGGLLVYGPLRNALGMSRVRVAYTAGEAIGPDLFVFYRSIGINLKQLYGSTETSVFVCVQPDDQVKPDTVGPPVEGVEVNIAESGEVLIRSPGLFASTTATPRRPRTRWTARAGSTPATPAFWTPTATSRSWIARWTSDGSRTAPCSRRSTSRNKLKFFPHIKEAVAFGDGRRHVTAMVNIDLSAVGDWAERRNLPYSGYIDLAAKEAVYRLVRECIEKVNGGRRSCFSSMTVTTLSMPRSSSDTAASRCAAPARSLDVRFLRSRRSMR